MVLAVIAWVLFAPIQAGGRTAYIIVSGISMEPTMYRGDMAILRSTGDYEVGDIVTYRQPEIGPVIHRIVDRDGDRFILQGDNNSWLDSYHPAANDIIGEVWIYLPKLGRTIEWLRSPLGTGLLVGLTGGLLLMTKPKNKNKRDRDRQGQRNAAPAPSGLGENFGDLLFLFGALAIAAVILGIAAFRQPLNREIMEDVPYEHVGLFTYTADVPPGIYDNDRAETGDPIFTTLSDEVNVNFDYRLSTELPHDVSVRYRLSVLISEQGGWERTIVLRQGTQVPAGAFSARSTLRISELREIIENLEEATGFTARDYMITVLPEVTVTGMLGGQPVQETFVPHLDFKLNDTSLWTTGTEMDDLGRIRVTQEGTVTLTHSEPNTLTILGLPLKVRTSRWIAGVGLGVAVLATGVLLLIASRAMRGAEQEQLHFQAGSRVVRILENGLDAGGPLVEVASVDDLVRLSHESGGPILYEDLDGVERYFVQGERVTYYYQIAHSHNGHKAPYEEMLDG